MALAGMHADPGPQALRLPSAPTYKSDRLREFERMRTEERDRLPRSYRKTIDKFHQALGPMQEQYRNAQDEQSRAFLRAHMDWAAGRETIADSFCRFCVNVLAYTRQSGAL